MPSDINSIQAWCAIISTFVTALASWFVVQTFSMQAKVMMEQSKITRLEIERSIMENNPVFKISQTTIEHHPPAYAPAFNSEPFDSFRVSFMLHRNDIYSLFTEIENFTDWGKRNIQFFGFPYMSEEGIVEGTTLELFYSVSSDSVFRIESLGGSVNLGFTVNFYYKDLNGIDYHQKIIIHHNAPAIVKPPLIPKKQSRVYI
jgi:hypothetical protein